MDMSGWSPDQEIEVSLVKWAKEVLTSLGPGHSERIYHNSMLVQLRRFNVSHDTEVVIPVYFRDHNVGSVRLDIVVQGKLIVELKTIKELRENVEIQQLKKYLRTTNYRDGLLLNFGVNGEVTHKKLSAPD